MRKIKTKLPINVDEKFKNIFLKRRYYKMPILKTRVLKNIFLTHEGIAFKNLMIVKKSLPNAYDFYKPNAGFILKFYKKALEVFLVCKYGKSLISKKLHPNKNYLFVYSPWFGYFSWTTESLPRILKTINNHNELTLIIPEQYAKRRFVIESLKIFPNLKHEIIEDGIHMNIPLVTMPELKPLTYIFEPKEMKGYRSFIYEFIKNENIKIKTFDKIYVSRSKAKNRKIINNTEVENIFKKYGYKILNFEDFSFFEQIYLMKNCKVLAGIHGAGFANICFMPENSILFEMIKEYSSYKEERPSYWRLCSSLDLNYYIQYCKPKVYGDYDLWVGVDLIVDSEELKRNLYIIEQKS